MYTHVSPILQWIGPCYLFRSFRSIFLYNIITETRLKLSKWDFFVYHFSLCRNEFLINSKELYMYRQRLHKGHTPCSKREYQPQ